MKKSILTLLLLLTISCCFGQADITGVIGIKFGASKEEVIKVMNDKGYTVNPKLKALLGFDNVTFGAFRGCTFLFKFYENKFFSVSILLSEVDDKKVIDQHNIVVQELSKKYGTPNSYRNFKRPYQDGDGHEGYAIRAGKGEVNSIWSSETGNLSAKISNNLVVVVEYQDKKLVQEAINAQDKVNTADY